MERYNIDQTLFIQFEVDKMESFANSIVTTTTTIDSWLLINMFKAYKTKFCLIVLQADKLSSWFLSHFH